MAPSRRIVAAFLAASLFISTPGPACYEAAAQTLAARPGPAGAPVGGVHAPAPSGAGFNGVQPLALTPPNLAPSLGAPQSGPSATASIAAAAAPALSNPAALAAVFPGLKDSARPLEERAALLRVVAAARLETSGPGAALGAEAVAAYAAGLAAEAARESRTTDDSLRSVRERIALKYRLQDATAAMALLGGRDETVRAMDQVLADLQTGLAAHGDALVKKTLAALPAATNAAWHGRTAVVPIDADGTAIALKFERDGKGVKDEAPGLERAGRFGLDAPLPLATGSGYVLPIEPGAAHARYGSAVTAYLLPGKQAAEFFTYLGGALPKDWSRERKAQAIKTSALRAVDGMLRLFENGWFHETLTPLSHSEAAYEWNHWRTKQTDSLFEINRFGPTGIHNWGSGLEHANIRLSGLADFEHLKAFGGDSYDTNPMPDWDKQRQREAVGQNLFELGLLVMRAGYRNGIGAGRLAAILTEAFQRHAAGIDAVTGGKTEIDGTLLSAALTRSVRRFYGFHFVADWLPRPIVRRYNDWVAKHSTLRMIPAGEGLVMSGDVLHAFVMDVLRPYTEAVIGGVPDWASPEWRMATRPLELYGDKRVDGRVQPRLKTAVEGAIYPILALLYGIETGPYADWGGFRKPWVGRAGEDPDAETRRKKMGVLVGRQDARSLAQIERGLGDPDPLVRDFAGQALTARRDEGSLPLIAKILAAGDAEARRNALYPLYGRRDAGSLSLILTALRDPDDQVKSTAAGALPYREDASSLPVSLVDELINHPVVSVRRPAAGLLPLLRGAAFSPLIEKARSHDDPYVRDYAERAWAAERKRH